MQAPKLEAKRIFLIASENEALTTRCRNFINEHIMNTTIFTASDGAEAMFKADNVAPHVAIIDPQLAKIDGFALTGHLLKINKEHTVSIILLSDIPKTELYVDDVVTRRVQFLANYKDDPSFNLCISRALNRISLDEDSTYRLHFLAPEQILFNQGDPARSVFIVKRGELEVTQMTEEKSIVIGQVIKSEFVGEMAYFNSDKRSATVRALTDCELIEIPEGVVDMVLFSKPTWAKALVETLSRRLKRSNDTVIKTAI